MAGYDPSKASEVNQLIEQGLTPEQAIQQAGIPADELGNYSYDPVTSQLGEEYGPPTEFPEPAAEEIRQAQIEDYQVKYPGVPLPTELSGQTYEQRQVALWELKYPGIPAPAELTGQSEEDRQRQLWAIANPGTPYPYDEPYTRDEPVDAEQDYGDPYYFGGQPTIEPPPTQETSVDPNNLPKYDDEGNLLPGYEIDPIDGEAYWTGYVAGTNPAAIKAVPLDSPYYGLTSDQIKALGAADPTDPYIRARLGIPQLPDSTLAATPSLGTIKTGVPVVDQALSAIGALFGGIGSLFSGKPTVGTEAATTGQGIVTTTTALAGPPTDTASKVDPNTLPAYDDGGNLLPGYELDPEFGQPYWTGNTPTPVPTTDTTVNPASDPSQFPAYDDDGNLLPGYAINEETGDTYFAGVEPPITSELTILSEEETNALFAGVDAENVSFLAPPTAPPGEEGSAPLLTDAELAEIYGVTDPQEQGAVMGTVIYSDEVRAAMSDPEAIKAQQELNRLAAENPAPNPVAESKLIEDPAILFPDENEEPVDNAEAAPVDPSQGPAYDDEGNLQPGWALNEENDPTYVGGDYIDPSLEATAQEARPVDPEEDPFEAERLAAEERLDAQEAEVFEAGNVDPEEDPFEAERLAAEERLAEQEAEAFDAENVDPEEDPFEAERLAAEERLAAQEAEVFDAENVDETEDEGLPQGADRIEPDEQGDEDSFQGSQEAAIKQKAINQATLQSRYKQPGNTDWRVRLLLSKYSDYLYNADQPGILAPLMETNGVIFPYTPNISINYQANYEQYDLIHSNFRGLFYKNSRVGDVSVRGVFTAQDTKEANYLLAVIHFFRSVTKMFYGKDPERGTPPPLVYLNGLGDYQFSNHPCVVSSFNYTLPNDVDYIRATNPNNYGTNLLNRRTASASSPGGMQLAGARRLANALLPKGAVPQIPSPGSVQQNVSNTDTATYVPTKMEIDITLIPVQTRSQVSKQFSLKGFANGDLIKGGFW
jgi:hypothetical protein